MLVERAYSLMEARHRSLTEYVEFLPLSVGSAVTYGIEALRQPDVIAAVPAPNLTLARLAAEEGIELDSMLRRYVACYTLLEGFILEEAHMADTTGEELKGLLNGQVTAFDRMLEEVVAEYGKANQHRVGQDRRVGQVLRLLEGRDGAAVATNYDFSAHHVGLIAMGDGGEHGIRETASGLGWRLMLITPEAGAVWAWLGVHRQIDVEELTLALKESLPRDVSVALGESGKGLEGWRLSHSQAKAATEVALLRPRRITRYADVALTAAALNDELLKTSLREIYLDPLVGGGEGGAALRATLRAYFCAERNVTSAAAALGLSRHTVTSRLRLVETCIGQDLSSCAAELETALTLEELGSIGTYRAPERVATA